MIWIWYAFQVIVETFFAAFLLSENSIIESGESRLGKGSAGKVWESTQWIPFQLFQDDKTCKIKKSNSREEKKVCKK